MSDSSVPTNERVGRSRPNVVFLLADQLRHASVGYAGDSLAHTPNIDQLAAEGVRFDQAVSNTPVCAAYRASLFTGKYASSTGMAINELRIHPAQRCLGHVVSEAGYETGYIGKWHLWGKIAPNLADRHFVPRGPYRLGWDGFWDAYDFHHEYYKAFSFRESREKLDTPGFEPDHQTDLAIEFLESRAAGPAPFYLTVSYGTPHDPWTPNNTPADWMERFRNADFQRPPNWSETPDPYMDRFANHVRALDATWRERMASYYAMTANLDWNIGRLLDALRRLGLERDTLVVFTSDHGEMHGSHGRVQKLCFYEEAARVPFAMRWPGRIPAGSASQACLSAVDIAPTLLGLLGLEIPGEMEGMNLSPLALGQAGEAPEAAFLQGMGHTHLWIDGSEWRAVRDERYTYGIYRRDGSECLFDRERDPYQLVNLAEDDRLPELALYREMLKKRMRELDDTFEPCSRYNDMWTDGERNIVASARGPFPRIEG